MQEQPQALAEQQRRWAKIVAQAWADADYKARLLADPAAVLKDEGLDVPAGVQLQVLENTASVAHLVLPAPPRGAHGTDIEDRVSALSISPPCNICY